MPGSPQGGAQQAKGRWAACRGRDECTGNTSWYMSVAATQRLVVVYEGKKRRHGDSQAGSPTSPPRSTGPSGFKKFVVVRDQLGGAEGPRRSTEERAWFTGCWAAAASAPPS
ncbi:hypothetical protein Vretifemale_19763 [Volvox reticuliferus]|uniref:Uncharacterized protein n=1 Tax=Volvox reticuliferus TaxID=1737510 RepID=A0A8J4FYV0_9CHLO|nr:hypothetical protein Vretifemale_19763 [Volvox reticuliferus]